MSEQDEKSTAAGKALSKLGSAKGGRARANTLTPDERKEIARNAVRARWLKAGKLKDGLKAELQETASDVVVESAEPSPSLPFSMFRGKLKIGRIELECHVLNDLRRV